MNNQFDPNNMNNWQQQQQNFQRMQQQFKKQNTTSGGTRFTITLLLGFFPQLFLKIFGVADNPNDSISYGLLWIIGIAIIIVSGIIAFIFTKLFSNVKGDVIIPTTGMSAAMLSFTVFLYPGIGDGIGMFFVAMFMAFVFYILAAIITWIILLIFMMSKMRKQLMGGQNPFQAMMNPNVNQNKQPKTTTNSQNVNDNSNKQELNDNNLDSGFGTHFEPEQAKDVKGKNIPSKDQSEEEKNQDKK